MQSLITDLPQGHSRGRIWLPRATRLGLEVAVSWRAPRSPEWRAGRTINVSRSGVLCEIVADALPHLTELDFFLDLSAGRADSLMRDVVCRGRVARAIQVSPGAWHLGVTIDQYQVLAHASRVRFETR